MRQQLSGGQRRLHGVPRTDAGQQEQPCSIGNAQLLTNSAYDYGSSSAAASAASTGCRAPMLASRMRPGIGGMALEWTQGLEIQKLC